MSNWLEAVREVYLYGGTAKVSRLSAHHSALREARMRGLLTTIGRGGPRSLHITSLTRRGLDLMEGRVTQYVPYTGHGKNGGRAPGTHKRWKATWLMALPRTNEVRL